MAGLTNRELFLWTLKPERECKVGKGAAMTIEQALRSMGYRRMRAEQRPDQPGPWGKPVSTSLCLVIVQPTRLEFQLSLS